MLIAPSLIISSDDGGGGGWVGGFTWVGGWVVVVVMLLAVETLGLINQDGLALINHLGDHTAQILGENREIYFTSVFIYGYVYDKHMYIGT